MHREPRRWRTQFGSWVRAYTVPRLTRELQTLGHPVTPNAVYEWLAGRVAPHPDRALAISRLSGGEGYFLLLRGVYTSARPFGVRALERLGLPSNFALMQNQPNPFRASTVVRFELPERAHVTLTVFDAQGRRVRTLADRDFEAGFREVSWDRQTSAGETAGPGVYFYRLRAGDFTAERKLILLP